METHHLRPAPSHTHGQWQRARRRTRQCRDTNELSPALQCTTLICLPLVCRSPLLCCLLARSSAEELTNPKNSHSHPPGTTSIPLFIRFLFRPPAHTQTATSWTILCLSVRVDCDTGICVRRRVTRSPAQADTEQQLMSDCPCARRGNGWSTNAAAASAEDSVCCSN